MDTKPILLPFAFVLTLSACAAEPSVNHCTDDSSTPCHLQLAVELSDNITPENNRYGSNTKVHWAGLDGASQYENESKCASFLTEVLKQAYGWSEDTLNQRFGATRPSAATYFAALKSASTVVPTVDAIKPGDILAIDYTDTSWDNSIPPLGGPTGHIAIVVDASAKHALPKGSPINAAFQCEITVVDSTQDPHGSTDTRAPTKDDGVGTGVIRLYVDSAGAIVGHTWSTWEGSPYWDQTTRPVVVGRVHEASASGG